MSAANWGIWGGGGLNIFFRGRNVHQVYFAIVLVFLVRKGPLGMDPRESESAYSRWMVDDALGNPTENCEGLEALRKLGESLYPSTKCSEWF